MRARVRWEAKWLLICALMLAGCIGVLTLGLQTDNDVLAVGAGTVGVISFCFTALSTVDTIAAWRSRHEIVDSSDIEHLKTTEDQPLPVRRDHRI